MRSRRSQFTRVHRRAVATSECALILPLVLLVTFSTIEVCVAAFLKESATIAAYEGARVAIRKDATITDVRNRVTAVLNDRGVSTAALGGVNPCTVSPDPVTSALLTPISVTVQLPCAGNTIFPSGHRFSWFGGRTVTSQVVMRKEFEA